MSDTESMREWVDVKETAANEETDRLRRKNADLTKHNKEFALQHTKINKRNKELLAACPEHLLTIQELEQDNNGLKSLVAVLEKSNKELSDRFGDAATIEELLDEAQELRFIRIEGNKWETRHFQIKRHDKLAKAFNDFAKYEQLPLEKLTFMSKDKKAFYRGDQTAIEVCVLCILVQGSSSMTNLSLFRPASETEKLFSPTTTTEHRNLFTGKLSSLPVSVHQYQAAAAQQQTFGEQYVLYE
jgi:hypothetical protein